MKSDILRRQNFSSTTFNGALHWRQALEWCNSDISNHSFPSASSHIHNFLPILQLVHFCRSIQSLLNVDVPSGNLSFECAFENQNPGSDAIADPPYSSEWVAVVGSVPCWLVAIATQSPPAGQWSAQLQVNRSKQMWICTVHNSQHYCAQLCANKWKSTTHIFVHSCAHCMCWCGSQIWDDIG